MTQKEKALNLIAKQIKELDENKFLLDELKGTPRPLGVSEVRNIYFEMLKGNGYELSPEYKLVPLK